MAEYRKLRPWFSHITRDTTEDTDIILIVRMEVRPVVRRCRFGEHADDDPSGRLPRPKRASAVKDRENLGRVAPETIDDSVAVHDYLPKRWLPNLGNDAAGAWVVLEAADGRDDSFDDQVRVISRIAGEVIRVTGGGGA